MHLSLRGRSLISSLLLFSRALFLASELARKQLQWTRITVSVDAQPLCHADHNTRWRARVGWVLVCSHGIPRLLRLLVVLSAPFLFFCALFAGLAYTVSFVVDVGSAVGAPSTVGACY